ncbi:MAG: hypothetical protein AB7J40_04490 [Candidatus Altimarinota bacterium]
MLITSSAIASATVANQPGFDRGGFPVKMIDLIAGEQATWDTLSDRVTISLQPKKRCCQEKVQQLEIHLEIENEIPESPDQQLSKNPLEHTAGRLVVEVLSYFEPQLVEKGFSEMEIKLHLRKGISTKGTGLGSSGASPAAALKSLLHVLEQLGIPAELPSQLLAQWLQKADFGVPDNAIPSYFGGLNLITFGENTVQEIQKIQTQNPLFVLVTPTSFGISTQKAREAIRDVTRPEEEERWLAEAISFLKDENISAYADSMERAHEWFVTPRSQLYPENGKLFERVREQAKKAGALGVTISGAGPTMIAFVPNQAVGYQVGNRMVDEFRSVGHDAIARLCTIDTQGARLI